jgi:hypothetical protein
MSSDHLPGEYMFYFDSDRDFCAFSMKWVWPKFIVVL